MSRDQHPPLHPPHSGSGRDDSAAMGRPWVWGALAATVVLALAVMLGLPALLGPRLEPGMRASAVAVTTESGRRAARADAEQNLRDYLRIRARLELLHADAWAAEEWKTASDLVSRGDQGFGRRRFGDAAREYAQALQVLQRVENERDSRLATALATAQNALDKDRVEIATQNFEQALAIDPDNEDGERGLERAQRREQVVRYVGAAKQAEASQDWSTARASYAKALELDAQYGPARSGLDRAAAKVAERGFTDAMGRALSALAASRLDEAATALETAGKLRPDDKALAEARRQLLLARRGARATALRSRAATRVKAEDWQAAAKLYKQALAVVPDAVFARDGLARARARLALHERIDAYLSHPTRLYSLEPLADAEDLLAGIGEIPADEPVLAHKAEKLARQIAEARVPLAVTLRSDGETDVMIYRVDRLGRFQERQVELRPGVYTVVGSRPGYRDVRRQLSVRPGVPPAPLMIRCNEPI